MRRALALLALALVASCKANAPGWMSLPPPVEQHGVLVVTDGIKRAGSWFLGITGEATNHSGRDYTGCTIRIDCLDSLGAKVGTGVAECDEFEDGASWSFTATLDRSDVRDVQIVAAPVVRVRRGAE